MKAIVTLAVVAAVAGIVVWMVALARRDYREARNSPDRLAWIKNLQTAQLAYLLVLTPMLPIMLWVDPPAGTWVGLLYLVAVAVILTWILFRNRPNRHEP